METKPKFGAFSSSVDPSKLSETIVGTIKTVAGGLVFLGVFSTVDANTAIEQVGVLIPAAYSLWNSCNILFGLMQKVVAAYAKKTA